MRNPAIYDCYDINPTTKQDPETKLRFDQSSGEWLFVQIRPEVKNPGKPALKRRFKIF